MSRERPLTSSEKKLLDQLSRDAEPSKEALERLEYELETSAVARKAFGAELVRLRRLHGLAMAKKRDLPRKLQEALDSMPRAKSFDHLVALADAKNEPQPELDLIT